MDKKMGKHCSFLNSYVAIHVKYGQGESAERSCEESGCSNSSCSLSKNFTGNMTNAKDFLDQPKK